MPSACTLGLAGLRLRVEGPAPLVAGQAERWAAFRIPEEPPDVHLELIDPAAGRDAVPDGDYLFDRLDVRFAADVARARLRGWHNGSEGALDALFGLALQVSALARGALVVHAAAGVLDGQAWLMPGESGTGKSTAAREAGFDRVLADEMVVVRRATSGFVAWGTPFWSKGRTLPFDAGFAPLGVVARLRQADAVAARPMRQDDLAAYLIRSVVLYETSADARRRAFELACDVVEAVRGVELAFPKEGPWIRQACSSARS